MKKNLPKIVTLIFLLIFVFQMIGLIILLLSPNSTHAADTVEFKPQVSIGDTIKSCRDKCEGKTGVALKECQKTCGEAITKDSIGNYISAIYKYAIGVVGIIAAVVLMFGGVVWLTAGGNQTRISEAKAWIGASLTGVVIAMASYMILSTVNPETVKLRPISLPPVKSERGCCYDANKNCIPLSRNACEKNNLWLDNGICYKSTGQCLPKQAMECCISGNAMDCKDVPKGTCSSTYSKYTAHQDKQCTPMGGKNSWRCAAP